MAIVQDTWKCFVIVFTTVKHYLFCAYAFGLILAFGFYSVTEIICIKTHATFVLALSLTSISERETY